MKRVPVTSLESVPLPDGQTLKIEEIQQRKRILQAQIEGLNSQIGELPNSSYVVMLIVLASAGAVVVSPARRTHIHFAEEQEEAEAVEETEQVEETLTSEDDRRTPGAPTGEVIPEALVVAVESPRGVVTRQETVSPTVLATGLRRPPCL